MIIHRITPLISYIFDANMPLLGICFGHQLIAEIYGGEVSNDHAQKKTGSYSVMLTEEGSRDQVFSMLPQTFLAQYGHKDSVTKMPQGATLLATGDRCSFSALRYGPHAYTTQFHPELTANDVKWKLEHSPGYLPEGVSVESIVKESPEASSIIKLWIRCIVEHYSK
jgi:GMP synthase (glutamine-hydrolysing)